MWERTNVAISQHACLNIGAPMYGPFSDDWIALQCMDGPSIGTLSIHRRSIYRNAIHTLEVHTLECYPYIEAQMYGWSIHWNAIHTSEVRCMDSVLMYGPSNLWTLQWSPTWIFFRLPKLRLMDRLHPPEKCYIFVGSKPSLKLPLLPTIKPHSNLLRSPLFTEIKLFVNMT